MSIFSRLAALTEEFAKIAKERKLPREVQEAKLRAWKLAYEYHALEARFPVLKIELQEAVEALAKGLHTGEQPAPAASTAQAPKAASAAPAARNTSTTGKGSEKK